MRLTHANVPKFIPVPFGTWKEGLEENVTSGHCASEHSAFKKPATFTDSLHNTLFIKTHKLALF